MIRTILSYAAGYAFAVGLGHLLIRPLTTAMLPADDPDSDPKNREHIRHALILPPAVGMVERVLYTSALLAGQGTLIGIWLGLKAVGSGVFVQGKDRHIYQRFLIGSAVSLAYAAVGWWMISWLDDTPYHVTYAVVAPLALIAATSALTRYVNYLMDSDNTGLTGLARAWYYTSQRTAALIAKKSRIHCKSERPESETDRRS